MFEYLRRQALKEGRNVSMSSFPSSKISKDIHCVPTMPQALCLELATERTTSDSLKKFTECEQTCEKQKGLFLGPVGGLQGV